MKITFSLLLLFLSFSVFCQDTGVEGSISASPTDPYNEFQEVPQTSTETQQQEVAAQPEAASETIKIDPSKLDPKLTAELQDFQKNTERFLQTAEKHKNDPAYLFKSIMGDTGKKGGLWGDGDMEAFIRSALLPYRIIPEHQLYSLLLKKSKGTFFYDFLNDNPSIISFAVKMLRDEIAIPIYARLVKDKVRLASFLVVNIVIIIIGWLMKRYTSLRPRGVVEGIKLWFARFLFVNGSRIIVLIFFFHVELSPTWQIFKDVFFN